MPSARRAFTLIELLVVVAIIALLISILLPALGSAREQARTAVCGQRLRDMGTGLATYFAEHNEWIPGVNTSGVAIRRVVGLHGEYNRPKLPVQSFDWITPIISPNLELSAYWPQRWQDLINRFLCPSQQAYKATLWPQSSGLSEEHREFFDKNNWNAVSYLMPAHFQYWGSNYDHDDPTKRIALGELAANPAVKIYAWSVRPAWNWEAVHPTYKSRLSELGAAGQKIAAADGTRFLTAALMVNFDASPHTTYFGSFTAPGAWWSGCQSFGVGVNTRNWNNRSVSRGSDSAGRNLALSYRHGPQRGAGLSGSAQSNKGLINALFFDGSVRRLSDRQSRNPVYWYPRGARVSSSGYPSQVMTEDFDPGQVSKGQAFVP